MPKPVISLNNLLELQNKIKRDPNGYYDDFSQAHVYFKSCIDLFELEPNQPHKGLQQLISFMAYITPCYPEELKGLPHTFKSLLLRHKNNMHSHLRMSFCKALTFYRNRNIITSPFVTELFFELCSCQDKQLRSSIKTLIKADIKNINKKHCDVALNSQLQTIVFGKLRISNVSVAKVALNILTEMFRKRIWTDAKIVNSIANCLFSPHTILLVKSLAFFVKRNDAGEIDIPDSDSEHSDKEERKTKHEKQLKNLLQASVITKKTKRKARKIERAKKVLKKEEKNEAMATFNLPALDLIYDPQSLAEKLLKFLNNYNGKFHIKLMVMDLISRLIGVHKLIVLNFYPYLQRYLHAQQKEVTKCLLFAAQATHEDVPEDDVEKLIQNICYNFVSDQNADEVMAVGLNAVREILSRQPRALDNNEDLVDDLTQFKKHRNRGVVTASRSIIQLLREANPSLLKSKERGKPSEHMSDAIDSKKQIIAGVNVLVEDKDGGDEVEKENLSENEENDEDEEIADSDSECDEEGSEWEDTDDDSEGDLKREDGIEDSSEIAIQPVAEEGDVTLESGTSITSSTSKNKVEELLMSRILTDEDFKKIKIENLRKKMQFASKSKKRKLETANKKGKKRTKLEQGMDEEIEIDSEDLENESSDNEGDMPTYESIASVNMKKRHDKDAKMASVLEGREGREKFGRPQKRQNPHASTTNVEKGKKKNFMMMRHKTKGNSRRRSFKERQLKLKNSLKRRYPK